MLPQHLYSKIAPDWSRKTIQLDDRWRGKTLPQTQRRQEALNSEAKFRPWILKRTETTSVVGQTHRPPPPERAQKVHCQGQEVRLQPPASGRENHRQLLVSDQALGSVSERAALPTEPAVGGADRPPSQGSHRGHCVILDLNGSTNLTESFPSCRSCSSLHHTMATS